MEKLKNWKEFGFLNERMPYGKASKRSSPPPPSEEEVILIEKLITKIENSKDVDFDGTTRIKFGINAGQYKYTLRYAEPTLALYENSSYKLIFEVTLDGRLAGSIQMLFDHFKNRKTAQEDSRISGIKNDFKKYLDEE